MNKKYLYINSLASALLLSGCVSIPQLDRANITEIHQTISTDKGINQEKVNSSKLANLPIEVVQEQWWNTFNDQQLNQLINKVLSHNIDNKIANLNLEKVASNIQLAGSYRYPQVNLDASLQKQRLPEEGFYPPPLGGSTINFGQIGVKASYDLDLFDKVSNNVSSLELQKQSIQAKNKALVLSLSIQTFKLYAYWQYLLEQERVIHEQQLVSEQLIRLEKNKVQYGIGLPEEVLARENNKKILDNSLEQIQIDKNKTYDSISQLTGSVDKIDNYLKSNDFLDGFIKNFQPINRVDSAIISQRPDVQSYLLNIKSQEKLLQILQADFYPSVTLNGEAGLQKIGLDNLFKAGNIFYNVMPTINLPIFDAGRIKTHYQIAGLDLNVFIEQYNQTVVKAYYDIDHSLEASKKSYAILQNQTGIFSNSSQQDQFNNTKYSLGKISHLDLYNSKVIYLSQKKDLLTAKFNYINNYSDLIASLSGTIKKS